MGKGGGRDGQRWAETVCVSSLKCRIQPGESVGKGAPQRWGQSWAKVGRRGQRWADVGRGAGASVPFHREKLEFSRGQWWEQTDRKIICSIQIIIYYKFHPATIATILNFTRLRR